MDEKHVECMTNTQRENAPTGIVGAFMYVRYVYLIIKQGQVSCDRSSRSKLAVRVEKVRKPVISPSANLPLLLLSMLLRVSLRFRRSRSRDGGAQSLVPFPHLLNLSGKNMLEYLAS